MHFFKWKILPWAILFTQPALAKAVTNIGYAVKMFLSVCHCIIFSSLTTYDNVKDKDIDKIFNDFLTLLIILRNSHHDIRNSLAGGTKTFWWTGDLGDI